MGDKMVYYAPMKHLYDCLRGCAKEEEVKAEFCKVKYLRVVDPTPPPPPTGPAVTSINDGTFHSGNGNVVTGVNMRFADEFPGNHLVIRDSNGEDIQAMISTDDDVPRSETSFGLIIDHSDPLAVGDEYTFEFEMLDEGGLPVTVTKTARWQE